MNQRAYEAEHSKIGDAWDRRHAEQLKSHPETALLIKALEKARADLLAQGVPMHNETIGDLSLRLLECEHALTGLNDPPRDDIHFKALKTLWRAVSMARNA